MRPSPPIQATVGASNAWRAAIVALTIVVAATVLGWIGSVHADAVLAGAAWKASFALSTFAGLVWATTLWKVRPISLRWDTQRWHLGPATSIGNEPQGGQLRVAIDLGGWMLLRFDPDPGSMARVRWIPVQESSVGQAWHALRCAVYSPRPESGDPSVDSALSASTRPHPAE